MNYTAIEWCDMTWNPVTGCLHGCEYCYARGTVRRFGEKDSGYTSYPLDSEAHIVCLDMPMRGKAEKVLLYPYGFNPTFHRYRLSEPARKKTPQNIFVVSMGDLFGDWVPDEWIKAVFEACEAAPWHNYMFLTKNPKRYLQLAYNYKLPSNDNHWYGTTATADDADIFYSGKHNTFINIEPMLAPFSFTRIDDGLFCRHDWIIIGAKTGNRKNKITPKREWIESIVGQCRDAKIPVFMKNSLAGVWGEPLIQEYPAGLTRK